MKSICFASEFHADWDMINRWTILLQIISLVHILYTLLWLKQINQIFKEQITINFLSYSSVQYC